MTQVDEIALVSITVLPWFHDLAAFLRRHVLGTGRRRRLRQEEQILVPDALHHRVGRTRGVVRFRTRMIVTVGQLLRQFLT